MYHPSGRFKCVAMRRSSETSSCRKRRLPTDQLFGLPSISWPRAGEYADPCSPFSDVKRTWFANRAFFRSRRRARFEPVPRDYGRRPRRDSLLEHLFRCDTHFLFAFSYLYVGSKPSPVGGQHISRRAFVYYICVPNFSPSRRPFLHKNRLGENKNLRGANAPDAHLHSSRSRKCSLRELAVTRLYYTRKIARIRSKVDRQNPIRFPLPPKTS
jgi:hypothetical protein